VKGFAGFAWKLSGEKQPTLLQYFIGSTQRPQKWKYAKAAKMKTRKGRKGAGFPTQWSH